MRGAIAVVVLTGFSFSASAQEELQYGLDTGLAYEDEALSLRARGHLAADYRHYDRRNTRGRGVRLDPALLGLEGQALGWISFRVLADAKGTDTRDGLREAWLSLDRAGPWIRLTGGLLEIPLGIEHSLPLETLPFVDHGLPRYLAGRTDLALRLDGELGEGIFSYDLSLAFGEGFDAFGQRRSDPQIGLRVVSYPLRWVGLRARVGPYDLPLVSGVFLSAAGAYTFGYDGRPEFATSLRNQLTVFGRLEGDASAFLQLGYGVDLGPFRLTHEFGRGSLDDVVLPDGTIRDFNGQISSWAATFAWRVTGEAYDSRPYQQRDRPAGFPARPIAAESGETGPGMIELAARYANGEIDRALIDTGLTTSAIPPDPSGLSSQEFRTFSASLSWWPVRTARLLLQVTRTLADQRPAVFDSHGRDTSFVFRLQVSF